MLRGCEMIVEGKTAVSYKVPATKSEAMCSFEWASYVTPASGSALPSVTSGPEERFILLKLKDSSTPLGIHAPLTMSVRARQSMTPSALASLAFAFFFASGFTPDAMRGALRTKFC